MLAQASVRPCCCTLPTRQRHGLVAASSSGRWRPCSSRSHAWRAAAAQPPPQQQPQQQPDESSSSSIGGSGRGQRKRGLRAMAESQPQLQAWLQHEQGLPAAEADKQARRLAHIFGSQQAALDGLPATFEWCGSRGLTGLQTAQLLDRIARKRHENVVQFAALVQPVWLLLDSHIAAYVEPLRQAGARLPRHTSLAEVLCSSSDAAQSLGMRSGHVAAWLATVGDQLPTAAIGRLLLSHAAVVTGSPAAALAALDWAASALGVSDAASFFAGSMQLKSEAATLQRNLASLQQALGCTADQARQLVLKQPALLGFSPNTVQAAVTWLRQLFPDAEQLATIVNSAPQLLVVSVEGLQANADYLRQELGWQDGDGQLAAFVAARPQPFATVCLGSEGTQHKLRLLSEVVGISMQECLTNGIAYMKGRLETICAVYMLVQERAPELLRNKAGELHLSWIINANKPHNLPRLGMTRPQFNAFVRGWPASEEGRRLLEGLRAGSVEGWPRPPVPGLSGKQQTAEAEQLQQARAARRTGTAAAIGDKRRGRGRRGKSQGDSDADGGSGNVEV